MQPIAGGRGGIAWYANCLPLNRPPFSRTPLLSFHQPLRTRIMTAAHSSFVCAALTVHLCSA